MGLINYLPVIWRQTTGRILDERSVEGDDELNNKTLKMRPW